MKAFLRARHAEEALRRSNLELERFAFMVAHDLNEPLRTITAHTQLLARQLSQQLDEKDFEQVRFIVDGAQRMRFLIDDILKYSQATNVGFDLQEIDCEALLEVVIASLDALIQTAHATITHDPLPRILIDPKIELALQNLISNAIKYCKPGVPPMVHVSAVADRGTWMFSVRDNGVGIEPQYKDGIFEIFRRLHGREIAGNGIGLALCQKIIDAHGGKIWVESSPGVGSVFYFTVPQG
jgi:light-regulated signal transduction histidine kinase (bacteriophytochrome)